VTTATSTSFDFALIGDVPYSADDIDRALPNLVADLNRYKTLRFVVHDGDIKSAKGVPCTAELLAHRHRQFKQIVAPFVLVFGDNDWRDCGAAHDPPSAQLQSQLQALALLRREFTADGSSGALRLDRRSPSYPEILHWTIGHIRFVGLNVPGPDNNVRPGYEAESEPRDAANIAELRDAFSAALDRSPDQSVRGIVIIFQAKPFSRSSLADGAYKENASVADLLAVIKSGAQAISPRPVVLVHGDSHSVTIDQPLPMIGNFTRISTFGSPFVHWIRVSVDATDPSVFAFHLQIVPNNIKGPYRAVR
jgi:hypothetical protein